MQCYRCPHCEYVQLKEYGRDIERMVCPRCGVVRTVSGEISGQGKVLVATPVYYLAQDNSPTPVYAYVQLQDGPVVYVRFADPPGADGNVDVDERTAALRGQDVNCWIHEDGGLLCTLQNDVTGAQVSESSSGKR